MPAPSARSAPAPRPAVLVAISAALALLSGCDLAPVYTQPAVQTPAAFKEQPAAPATPAEGWKPAEPGDAMARGAWWELFQDPDLNALEAKATLANPTIATALAQFQAARAGVQQSQAQYYPTVTASPAVTRGRQVYAPTPANPTPVHDTTTLYTLPFDASWEPDFFGGIRNAVRASSYEAQASFAELGGVRLAVQAEVAVDYLQLRVLDGQKRLLDAAVADYQESLKLTQDQLDSGMSSGEEVEQASTLLHVTQAQASDTGILRAQFEHAIATLLGQPASAFAIEARDLAMQPVPIPFGVPSQLLERRPDIAAAERRVAEANARIGVARAGFFPTTVLSGSAGYAGSSLGTLVSGSNLLWSLGASLTQTVFDGGRQKAVTAQARANYLGTVASYRQTVLGAFQDVEDNLSTLRILALELQQQDAAVDSSRRYLGFAQSRYQAGLDLYLDVITAQTALLGNQRTALNLRMQQLTASVQLVKALGGGWKAAQ
jgi:NodT family efflux transporter outer membrane factor (OMF) lipoprotein